MLDRQMKLLLRLGALIMVAVAVLTLLSPSLLANALGLPLDFDPEVTLWALRLSAGLALPLAGLMALAAAFFPERALRQSGALMVIFAVALSLLLAIAPAPWGWARVAFLVVAIAFIALYLKALRARLRHR